MKKKLPCALMFLVTHCECAAAFFHPFLVLMSLTSNVIPILKNCGDHSSTDPFHVLTATFFELMPKILCENF